MYVCTLITLTRSSTLFIEKDLAALELYFGELQASPLESVGSNAVGGAFLHRNLTGKIKPPDFYLHTVVLLSFQRTKSPRFQKL